MHEVLTTSHFDKWFANVDNIGKKDILAIVEVLKNFGPTLGRPYVDTLKGSKIPNLKELRIRSIGRPFRVLFIFDVKRRAILLIGGNKANDKKFYKKYILIAEKIYNQYTKEILKNEEKQKAEKT